MATLVFMVLLFSMAGHSSASWCVCKDGLSDAELQKTLDYACGSGADCNPTHQNGPCYNPNTVRAHCSYAVNSYFQKNRQLATACNFSGTAAISNSDPSSVSGCAYPATASGTGTSTTTPVGGSGGNSPVVTTPNGGILGGGNSGGLGPSGMNNDVSHGGFRVSNAACFFYSAIVLAFSALVFW